MDQIPSLTQSPAHLWIGAHDTVLDTVVSSLQKTLCAMQGCGVCVACVQIKTQQHPQIMWLYPEKQYTKEQFDPLFHMLSFALESNEHCFFVIQKSDFLTPATADRLLKSLEEPPRGYHFILLAERLDQLLPTIQSRCIIHEFSSTHQSNPHDLFTYFNKRAMEDASLFLKELDQSKINERESIEMLDALIHHWSTLYKKAVIDHNKQQLDDAQHVLSVLQHAYANPPMPGSSKLFWRDLYLQIQ